LDDPEAKSQTRIAMKRQHLPPDTIALAILVAPVPGTAHFDPACLTLTLTLALPDGDGDGDGDDGTVTRSRPAE